MSIDPQYIGKPYRQLSARLRVQRGPGRPDLVSERPRDVKQDGSLGRYVDSEEAPTLVTFDAHCQVDVPSLLQIGAIAEYAPPAPEAAGEEDAGGEIPSEPY